MHVAAPDPKKQLNAFTFMKIWIKIAFICSCVLLPGIGIASPLKVGVSAKGAILINADTGAVLWEKNAHTPMHPASTTKMITALYAVEKERFALDEMVTASYDAVCSVHPSVRRSPHQAHPPYRLEFGGTHMGIKAGETLPFRSLLYGLLLSSGNDAANVIAESVSGSIPVFMEELNRFVREKGCLNTVLYAPHGLPYEGHQSTAYDLGILARALLRDDLLSQIVKTTQAIRPQTNKQAESMLLQHNALMKPGPFFYPRAIGIKTGYTLAAGYCLVAAAEDPCRKLIAVLLGCAKKEARYKDAIALFEAAFHETKVSRILFSKGFDLFSRSIEGGKEPLQACLSQDLGLEYYPSEEPAFKTSLLWDKLDLPIVSGQRVAQIQITSAKGKVLAAAPLHAIRGVDPTLYHRVNLVWKETKQKIWENAAWVMGLCGFFMLAAVFYCYTPLPPSNLPKKADQSLRD